MARLAGAQFYLEQLYTAKIDIIIDDKIVKIVEHFPDLGDVSIIYTKRAPVVIKMGMVCFGIDKTVFFYHPKCIGCFSVDNIVSHESSRVLTFFFGNTNTMRKISLGFFDSDEKNTNEIVRILKMKAGVIFL